MKQILQILLIAIFVLNFSCSVKVPAIRTMDDDVEEYLNRNDKDGNNNTNPDGFEDRSNDLNDDGEHDNLGDGAVVGGGNVYVDDGTGYGADEPDLPDNGPGCVEKPLFSIWSEQVPANYVGEVDVLNFLNERYDWEFNMGASDYGTLIGNSSVGYFNVTVRGNYDVVLSTEYRRSCGTLRICYIAWYEDLGLGNYAILNNDFSKIPANILSMEGIERTSTNLTGLFGPVGKVYERCLYYK